MTPNGKQVKWSLSGGRAAQTALDAKLTASRLTHPDGEPDQRFRWSAPWGGRKRV
jgi:hypothetical protein